MQKTVAVEVSQYYRHPKYHKYIKTSKKFLTHDEGQMHDTTSEQRDGQPGCSTKAPHLAAVIVSHSVCLCSRICLCVQRRSATSATWSRFACAARCRSASVSLCTASSSRSCPSRRARDDSRRTSPSGRSRPSSSRSSSSSNRKRRPQSQAANEELALGGCGASRCSALSFFSLSSIHKHYCYSIPPLPVSRSWLRGVQRCWSCVQSSSSLDDNRAVLRDLVRLGHGAAASLFVRGLGLAVSSLVGSLFPRGSLRLAGWPRPLAVHSLSAHSTRRTMSGSEAAAAAAAAGATIVSPKPVAAAVAPVVMADAQAEADAAAAAAAARAHAAAADQQGEVRFSSPPLTQVGRHTRR